jgi:hypothetical protein
MRSMGHFTKLVSVAAATLLLFSTLGLAQTSPSQSGQPETPDGKEIRTFRLTKTKLDKYEVAANGVAKLLHDHPELKKSMNMQLAAPGGKNNSQIDQGVINLEMHPELANAVKESGLSSREYVVMSITLVNTMMLVALKRGKMITEYPASISPQNAGFVERNYDRVSAIMASLMGSTGEIPDSDQNN